MSRRSIALATVLVAAGCTAQVAAPRSAAPSASSPPASAAPTGRPLPTLAASIPDALYVRQSGQGAPTYITRMDVDGNVLGALPDGVLSADRSTLYAVTPQNGATQTRVRELDVATGMERRAFTLDGDLVPAYTNGGAIGLSLDGGRLVLALRSVKVNGLWESGLAVVDLRAETIAALFFRRETSFYSLIAVSPHGDALVVRRSGEGATETRIWDTTRDALLAVAGGWDGAQRGFATEPLRSSDGERLFWLDAGDGSGAPAVRILDIPSRSAVQVALPATQTTDFEKYLLWSVAIARDGKTLFAVNPALGVVDEVDTVMGRLVRTAGISTRQRGSDLLARIGQLLFPVAEAKRYMRGGAALSPDGGTLFAAATRGIAVIDTASLRVRGVWTRELVPDALTLTADGGRLYVIDDATGRIGIVRTGDGALLGTLAVPFYANTIVRIDHAITTRLMAPAPPAPCGVFRPPDANVPAEIQHLKTSAAVIEVTSPCTVTVRIGGGQGPLAPFTDRVVALRATRATTFRTAKEGDLGAIGRFGLHAGDAFTLSFDSRAFPDGSFPLNFMND